jgi:tripartite-type tricarboxylate transporter receptor subunit TctC
MKLLSMVLAGLTFASFPAFAQNYPNHPVRILVTAGPGSSADLVARIAADELSKKFAQPFVVENRPGAGGNIAADVVAKSKPDGYTLLMSTISTHGINPSLYRTLSFDPVKDFAPIALLASNPNVLVVSPTLPASTLQEMLALAKKAPTGFTYSSGGTGTSQHLAGEMMAVQTGIQLTHIPYKSAPESANALLGNQVSMSFLSIPVAQVQIKAGKLKAIGVTSSKTSPAWTDLGPPLALQGLKDFDVSAWFGLVAPAGTPAAIVQTLNMESVAIFKRPDIQAKLNVLGMEELSSTPEFFDKFIKSEISRWSKIVVQSVAKAD